MERGNKCIYQRLDNNIQIQEFVFRQSSHAAVDEFIEHLSWIAANEPLYQTATITRVLMDTRPSGSLPMYYLAKRVGEWAKSQPLDKQKRPIRTAQLNNSHSAYVTIARNLSKVFHNSRDQQEYFQNDRDGAIAWLLKND